MVQGAGDLIKNAEIRFGELGLPPFIQTDHGSHVHSHAIADDVLFPGAEIQQDPGRIEPQEGGETAKDGAGVGTQFFITDFGPLRAGEAGGEGIGGGAGG